MLREIVTFMPLEDWLLVISLFLAGVFITGTAWYLVREEIEYRRYSKTNHTRV